MEQHIAPLEHLLFHRVQGRSMIDYIARRLAGGLLKFFAGVAIALLLLSQEAQKPAQVESAPEPSEQTVVDQ